MPHIYFSPEVKEYLTNTPNLTPANKYDGMVDIACGICDNNYMRFFENDTYKFTCEECW